MNNWQQLNDEENIKTWNFIYNEMKFKPVTEDLKSLINLPTPCRIVDISNYYNEGFDETLYDELHEYAHFWFNKISQGKKLYALNWKHESYSFFSDLPFEKNEFDEWIISIFPNGDYIFFLTSDFKNGIFADGINLSLSFWGVEIMEVIQSRMPRILSQGWTQKL